MPTEINIPLPQRDLSVLAGAYTTSGKKHNFAIGNEQFNFAGLPYAEMEVTKLAETIPDTTQLRDEDRSRWGLVLRSVRLAAVMLLMR